jgi:hypothetical protein
VRDALVHLTLVSSTVLGAFGSIGASPATAQTFVTSVDELRHELVPADIVTLVPAVGQQPIKGRLTHVGETDLDIRLIEPQARQQYPASNITVALTGIQWLERPRDPVRNGLFLGAGIGAGFAGAMFVHALAIDRNEIDEWAGSYVGLAVVSSAIGALIGWAIDAARSKPHIRFDAPAAHKTQFIVQPVLSGGRGLALAVSF